MTIRERFRIWSGRPVTAVASAPGRVNLIGEHIDYLGGACLPIATHLRCRAAYAARTDDIIRVRSDLMREELSMSLAEIPTYEGDWGVYVAGVVAAMHDQLAHDMADFRGMDLLLESDVPIGAGLASSAALECAVACAVAHSIRLPLDYRNRQRLADACVLAEQAFVGAPTGGLDQTSAMLCEAGSALLVDFAERMETQVRWSRRLHNAAVLVTDTGSRHDNNDGKFRRVVERAGAVAQELDIANLVEATPEQIRGLNAQGRPAAQHAVTERQRVHAVVDALTTGDEAAVGKLFNESHASLRDLIGVSCPELDMAVDAAVRAGAWGARLTGAGFGGCAIAFCPQDKIEIVARSITEDFHRHGWSTPHHFTVHPGPGATVV